ncbi:hypothetical protein [Sphingomonas alpina]|uniref:Uncharacterized protein n=1 Tax=Sphingomonas alpina TaxID=653931 RepID=A0A7H0LNV1_9SPHN|nr:hypothetical protein [Sphingomonas alpina]QNQ11354.1 hypothetical protein H3Z74_09540 [Sphingomonas alpina]
MPTRHRAATNYHGFALATFLAGPIYVTSMGIAIWTTDMSAAVQLPNDWSWVAALLPLTMFSMIGGAFLSIVPNLIGLQAMMWLGGRNPAMQLPVSWALAGVLSMAFVTMLAEPDSTVSIPGIALVITGAICALLCRRGVSWEECPLAEGP